MEPEKYENTWKNTDVYLLSPVMQLNQRKLGEPTALIYPKAECDYGNMNMYRLDWPKKCQIVLENTHARQS